MHFCLKREYTNLRNRPRKVNRRTIKKSIPEIIAFQAFHVLSHNNFRY